MLYCAGSSEAADFVSIIQMGLLMAGWEHKNPEPDPSLKGYRDVKIEARSTQEGTSAMTLSQIFNSIGISAPLLSSDKLPSGRVIIYVGEARL
jgi:hypothetical protein